MKVIILLFVMGFLLGGSVLIGVVFGGGMMVVGGLGLVGIGLVGGEGFGLGGCFFVCDCFVMGICIFFGVLVGVEMLFFDVFLLIVVIVEDCGVEVNLYLFRIIRLIMSGIYYGKLVCDCVGLGLGDWGVVGGEGIEGGGVGGFCCERIV